MLTEVLCVEIKHLEGYYPIPRTVFTTCGPRWET